MRYLKRVRNLKRIPKLLHSGNFPELMFHLLRLVSTFSSSLNRFISWSTKTVTSLSLSLSLSLFRVTFFQRKSAESYSREQLTTS